MPTSSPSTASGSASSPTPATSSRWPTSSGPTSTSWDGWAQIPEAVQANASYKDKRYGVPGGTDGRVLYFNKKLFQQAGLPADWQPASWQEILDAGAKLKAVSGVTPIQLNAGTAMGEATTMQGALPLLVGTGAEIYPDGKWQGNTQSTRDVLGFYKQIYCDQGLVDTKLQQDAKGRDKSFAAFAANKIGILLEGDYFWRTVVDPEKGVAPMANRDADVGYAKIPATGRAPVSAARTSCRCPAAAAPCSTRTPSSRSRPGSCSSS